MARAYAIRVGSITSGPLGAGLRASPGTVGYLGSPGALTTYNPGGSPPTGWTWDDDALLTTGANSVLNHALINGTVFAGHANPTITDCKVVAPAGQTFGISLNGSGKGFLVCKDTTIIGTPQGISVQTNGLSSDSGLIAVRCHIENTGDGIHATADTGTYTGEIGTGTGSNSVQGSIISQCHIGELAFLDEDQHNDAIQIFQHASSTAHMVIEHCDTARTLSSIDTPMNAGMTIGPASASGPLITPTINNNLFRSGLYHARMNFQLTGETFTNNNLDQLYADEFGLVSTEVTIDTWTNNRTGTGPAGTGTLVNHP